MQSVDNGNAQLPDFQRGWVWDDNRIKALIASIYSTKENAETAIEEHKDLEGFRDCPPECFEIDEYEVDRSAWTEGLLQCAMGNEVSERSINK